MSTALARAVLTNQRNAEAVPADVHDLGGLVEHPRREIALRLVGVADALLVFFELGRIVSRGEDILEQDGVRDAVVVGVLHGANHIALAEGLVAHDGDLADFDLRTFVDVEDDLERRGRDLMHFRLDGGELAAALGQVFLNHHGGALDLVRDRIAIRPTDPLCAL